MILRTQYLLLFGLFYLYSVRKSPKWSQCLYLSYHNLLTKIPMKNNFRFISYLFSLLALASVSFYSCTPATSEAAAEDTAQNKPTYHVSENDAANIAIVTNYLNSLVTGDGSVAQGLVNANFMSYGPSVGDSATIEQVMAQWVTNAATRTEQEAGLFASNGLTVTDGPFTGDWVMLWGRYTCNDNKSGLDLTVPWHSVNKIENGKISLTRAWFDSLAPSLAVGAVVPAK
jgi:ketosteroid isomerase-like protein